MAEHLTFLIGIHFDRETLESENVASSPGLGSVWVLDLRPGVCVLHVIGEKEDVSPFAR